MVIHTTSATSHKCRLVGCSPEQTDNYTESDNVSRCDSVEDAGKPSDPTSETSPWWRSDVAGNPTRWMLEIKNSDCK